MPIETYYWNYLRSSIMNKDDLRIVFLGTPEFAETVLRTLVENKYNIVGVVTMPDKPSGRHGSILSSSPVKRYAQSCGIPILQPEKLKAPDFIEELASLKADLQIVVAFRMLPEIIWNMPAFGTINLHASLLPQYRGAAPINWAIINGEKETGVTTFFLQHDIDTGDIIRQERIDIDNDDNAGTLHDKLMLLGSDLIMKTVDDIIIGRVSRISQNNLLVDKPQSIKSAPKIFNDTCRIDWRASNINIRNFIRGMSPYPAAWTILNSNDGRNINFKVFSTEFSDSTSDEPGSIHTDGKSFIEVSTGKGCLRLTEVQIPGKKRMSVNAFLCGFELSDLYFFS